MMQGEARTRTGVYGTRCLCAPVSVDVVGVLLFTDKRRQTGDAMSGACGMLRNLRGWTFAEERD
jgi:hypothetical protein